MNVPYMDPKPHTHMTYIYNVIHIHPEVCRQNINDYDMSDIFKFSFAVFIFGVRPDVKPLWWPLGSTRRWLDMVD